MKAYQKPQITVFRYASKEAISDSFGDWLTAQTDFQDTGITAYAVTSLQG